ncbi:MAG: helicase [Chloroflexi bacterium OHK40]
MSDLVEALHNLARERSRGGPSPLIAVRSLAAREGSRISHLGISQQLAQAWVSVTGEPFRPHQSLGLAAMRRGEPLALVGGLAARQSLLLLAVEVLRAEGAATALLLAPDESAAAALRGELQRLFAALGEPLRAGLACGPEARLAIGAQVVVSTPAALHERLLRHHARAWASFWPRLRLLLVIDAHCYDGLGIAHVGWLLLRARRLCAPVHPPRVAATVAPVAAFEEGLALLSGEAWRVVPANDTPRPRSAVALWRSTADQPREAVAVALGLARAGARAHIVCAPFEAPLLRALVGPDMPAVTVGPTPLPASAQILLGVGVARHLRACSDSAALTVLVLGDDPAERTLARLAAQGAEPIPLLDGPPAAWVVAPGNAYLAAQHLVCAASELPLAAAEVAAWGVESIVERLVLHGQLVRLPGPEPAWQPLPTGNDPYGLFDLRSAGADPVRIRDDQGTPLGTLDLPAFDRWGFASASLPPVRGGFRVLGRDEEGLELTIRGAPDARRTMPLRRCAVRVRDQRESRRLRGREVAWGRVVVEEEVYGYREVSPGNAPVERVISPPLSASWSAPALWVELPAAASAGGQLAGWSLVIALQLQALCTVSDLVPVYDDEARRIYFVDAQSGGNGLAAWLFAELETVLPIAYDVALDCRADPLLEPLARADKDWLLALLAEQAPGPPPAVPPSRPATVAEEPASPEPRRDAPEPPASQRRADPPVARRDPTAPAGAPRRAETATPGTPPPSRGQDGRPPERREPSAPRGRPRRVEPTRSHGRTGAPAQPPLPIEPVPPPEPAAPRPTAIPSVAPARPEPPGAAHDPPPEPEVLPNAAAMVARLRRMREQRQDALPLSPRRQQPNGGEPRFAPGDTIVCTPYGRGEVVSSRVEDGRELLVVQFDEHGELTIDAAVSAARLADEPPSATAEPDF